MKNDFSVIINEIPLYNKIDSILCQIIKYFPQLIPAVQYDINIVDYIYELYMQLYNQKESNHDVYNTIKQRICQISTYRNNLYTLLTQPQVAQRSPEWYELRKNRLTASAVAQAIGKGKFSTKAELLKDKAFPELAKPFDSHSCPPLRHGIILEDMTARCYSQRLNNIKIHNFGMIPHPTLNCFGASPDGINELGIMVEIKTPYRRRVDGNIPYEYMVQMQGQMAVCALNECDFVDAEIYFNYKCIEDYISDNTNNIDHGVIVEYIDDTDKNANNKQYLYSPEYLTVHECIKWAEDIRTSKFKNKHCLLLPWKLNKIMIKRVYFNEEVWSELIPQIEDFWKEVITLRNAGVDALPKKINKYAHKTLVLDSTKVSNKIQTKYTTQFIDSDED
jgi:putative phage-type endonuclease